MSLDNLKKVVSFGLSLGEAIVAASEQTSALARAAVMLHLVEDVPVLFGVDYSKIGDEVKALSPADLDELNAYIDDNFELPDAKDKEAKIEAAISVVLDLAKVAEKAVAVWKAKSSDAISVAAPNVSVTP